MRRFCILFLVLILLFSACENPSGDLPESISFKFYYCVEGTDQLTSDISVDHETRTVQIYTLSQLMEMYMKGPVSDHLRTPFPEGTQMLGLSEGEDGLELTMSGAFFTLQGIELSVASYCLGKTVCEYLDTEHIILVDEMHRIHMEIRPDQYLMRNDFSSDSESVFTLYFPDENGRYLIPETRQVTLSPNESKEMYILRQLIQGPHSQDLRNPIPKDASVIHVETTDGLCTVDFSSDFYAAFENDPYGAYTAIYSIVNTLTGLEAVNEVQFLRDGELIDECGIFSLQKPLNRFTSSIGLIRPGGTELDINVYVCNKDTEKTFGVPVRVKQTIAQPLAEAVVQAVINFEAPKGFYNPIPYGTQILSISVSGNVCYLDLSRGFIPADGLEASEEAAVWALVTSLTDLDNISSVVLTIEGESSGMQYVDISEPLTAESVVPG